MAENPSSRPSWWQTVPGILTGIAAIITAATGLLVVLNRSTPARLEDATRSSQSASAATPAGSAVQSGSQAGGAATAAQSIALPTLNQVRFADGEAVIKILSAEIEPIDSERRSLKFVVRHTNTSRYPENFWSASYRLIVEDVPRAPTNLLDEVVDGNSAKEGEVVFQVPVSVKAVVLQISNPGNDKNRIPLSLP